MKELNFNPAELTRFELEIVQLVVEFGRMIGLQKSVCEIYGLLFASVDPQSMEQISTRLKMSLGSTSQGLKLLKDLGAVKSVYLPGIRKDYYQADFNFRKIVTKFLSDEIQPQLERTESRLKDIELLMQDSREEGVQEVFKRVGLIRKLNQRARNIVPAISKILSL